MQKNLVPAKMPEETFQGILERIEWHQKSDNGFLVSFFVQKEGACWNAYANKEKEGRDNPNWKAEKQAMKFADNRQKKMEFLRKKGVCALLLL